ALDAALRRLVLPRAGRRLRMAHRIGTALLGVAAVVGLVRAPAVLDPVTRGELALTAPGTWLVESTRAPALRTRARSLPDPLAYERFYRDRLACSGCNILLVTVDALRADQVAAARRPNRDAPQLSAFARGAVRFRRAYSQS